MIEDTLKALQSGNWDIKTRITFKLKIIPGSSKNEIVGLYGQDTIKMKIAAQPEKGKANDELIEFLSKKLKIPAYRISIIKGMTSHGKIIEIKP